MMDHQSLECNGTGLVARTVSQNGQNVAGRDFHTINNTHNQAKTVNIHLHLGDANLNDDAGMLPLANLLREALALKGSTFVVVPEAQLANRGNCSCSAAL
jgi:hypothetical protein